MGFGFVWLCVGVAVTDDSGWRSWADGEQVGLLVAIYEPRFASWEHKAKGVLGF